MSKYETLDYDVLSRDGMFEIRRYRSFYVVEHQNPERKNPNQVFRQLFEYISSHNASSSKISMTVPVLAELYGDRRTLSFIMPKSLGDNIPEPRNELLHVAYYEEAIYVAVKYSGNPTEMKINKHKDMLMEWVESHCLVKESNFIHAYYNQPLTLPFLKKNEILVRVSVENLIMGSY